MSMYNLPDTAAPIPAAQPQAAPGRGRGWLKWLGAILGLFVVLCGLLAVVGLYLLPSYGTKIEYTSSELYYTDAVTADEAKKVGDALQEYGYFGDDNAVSVQLDKVNGTYQVRFVVQEDKIQDESIISSFTIIGTLIRENALNGAPTVVHLTDNELQTIKVLDL